LAEPKHILTCSIVILMVTVLGIHSSISQAHALSEWETRAEAQYEFAKFVEKLQKEIELKDPQAFTDYKKVIVQLLPEFRQIIDRLDPLVKIEFCKLASTSSVFPVDCELLDQSLPLPTSQANAIRNSSDPCSALQTDTYLTVLEINTLQIQCDKKSNARNSENQTGEEISDETSTARAKERLNVGCDTLLLLSNETQNILKNMNKDIASCYTKDSKRN
jgi:hypothetical protein